MLSLIGANRSAFLGSSHASHAMQRRGRSAVHDNSCYLGGSGSSLVLLHGVGGTWHIWRPVIGLLESHHRVIAPTLPGHDGAAPLPAGTGPSVAVLADALLAQLAALGVKQAHVAGNSLGGWLALELARRGFALSVTALSPAGAWQTRADFQTLRRSILRAFVVLPLFLRLFGWLLRFARARRWLGRMAMQRADEVPADDFKKSLMAMANTAILPTLLRNIERCGPIEPFDVGTTPVRVVWSECDRTIPFKRYGQPMTRAICGAQFAILPDAGHVPMYDKPQDVAAHILDVAATAPAAANVANVAT
ncbi:alpha/beta fold hydrolase [Solimonas terrae]|uniref:Alpha/beta hydrolase n=1 Tax=Solimonas terrae TaxID=1396819 RepID=A0A6M2BWQ8_9GAMM|nr:alpha/beta hydrolase [Solimonas terrae]NGY06780.1 alpha/beta hydrolase [Solimonas terrae]